MSEEILEPSLPIIDTHHHLWFVPPAALPGMVPPSGDECLSALGSIYQACPRYLLDEIVADTASGHDIRATVYIEVHSMWRPDGPEHLRSVGEIEFANGMAAMADSGAFGPTKICAGIVGAVDLTMGDRAAEVLEAHVAAGNGRYRGIRVPHIAWDPSIPQLNAVLGSRPQVLADPEFRRGFAHLARTGLHCEVWLLESQLVDLIDLARAFPDTPIVLNHAGGLSGFCAGSWNDRMPAWRQAITAIAELPNVSVKLGGLGNPLCRFPSSQARGSLGSEQLAMEWRPYLEHCIEAFGVDRCMFESNFPVDRVTASYVTVWNAFKRITAGASPEEKHALYFGTAKRFYRLDV